MLHEDALTNQPTQRDVDLKGIISSLWQARQDDSEDGLRNQANSEHYLQEAYTGRYLFELIQNMHAGVS
jgi:hypothetical protein